MIWFSFDSRGKRTVKTGKVNSKLIFFFFTNKTFPPYCTFIYKFSDCRAHSNLIVNLSGLVNFEEILATTTRIANFHTIFSKMSHNLNLFQKSSIPFFFQSLRVSFFTINTKILITFFTVRNDLIWTSFEIAVTKTTFKLGRLRDALHVVTIWTLGWFCYKFVGKISSACKITVIWGIITT